MLRKFAMPLVFGAAVALTGTAFADDDKNPRQLYKESQPNANAKPVPGSVVPGAEAERKGLYKESQTGVRQQPVKDRAVNPDAVNQQKHLYKESQTYPHAEPKEGSVKPGNAMSK